MGGAAMRRAGMADRDRLLILATLLAAFALRCAGLDTQELRGDEAFGHFFSLPSYNEIIEQTLDLSEPHPVASYWLQHFWLGIAGHSEYALRFLGVWWSVLAVALTLPFTCGLSMPASAGMVAAALMALSPYTIWHAQDARMYSMSLALTLMSTTLAVRWWRTDERTQQLWLSLCYVGVTWLALHTHYFAVYIVVAQQMALAGWAVAGRAWRRLALWWAIGIVILLAWLPWLIVAWAILTGYHGNGDSPNLVNALIRAHSTYGIGETMPPAWQWLWGLLTVASMIVGALTLWTSGKRALRSSLWFLTIYWLIPLAATWLSAVNRPIFNERYLLAAVPPVYLLIGAGTIGLHRTVNAPTVNASVALRLAGLALIFLLLIGMVLGYARQQSDPAYSKSRGWRELALILEQMTRGVDPTNVRLVQNYPDPTLWYYYRGEVPHLVLPPVADDLSLAKAEVEQLVAAGVGRVILIEQPAESWDATGMARTSLSVAYSEAAVTKVANWPLSLWLRPPNVLSEANIAYQGGLYLKGATILPDQVLPGGVVEVHLQWQGNAAAMETVSVQVLNNGGELVAQSDRPLGMASNTTAQVKSYAILLPMSLHGGEYQIVVVVYDPSYTNSPRRLTVQGADHVTIGEVTVVYAE